MAGELGFYVHHHGSGHAARTKAIGAYLPGPITIFTSAPFHFAGADPDKFRIVALPSDVVPDPESPPDGLHYAPLNVPGIRQRMHALSSWFATDAPKLLVVDVSVEIGLFARLCSVPVVLVRQHGLRTDSPHVSAYQSCQSILAPFPEPLDEPAMPEWVRAKTHYAGGFSRYDGRRMNRNEARQLAGMDDAHRYVVVVSGTGGNGFSLRKIRVAAQACPDWQWLIVGPTREINFVADNIKIRGTVPDTFPYLVGADVVVASGGHNTVMEVAAARARLVCIPEPRPFDEQVSKARALQRIGAAVIAETWPPAMEWPALLERATRQDTAAWALVNDESGAARAASHIQAMIARL